MSFFKNVASGFGIRSRDTILKESLINNLSECVKDIQYSNQFEANFHSVLGSTESTSTLCMALEAVFLHGLKDTFLRKAKNAISGDPDYRPQSNFWPLVLVLSHRQNIDQISSLLQINTEVGQCRAWLRIALNECLLSSYMSTLLRNISAVKPFYNRSAFVCDSEILEVAQKLIEGMESCVQFNLPINSSILNQWPEEVLMLAGIWVPTMKAAPISACLDVASTITDENVTLPTTPTHIPQITGLGNILALSEDEALNFILSKNSNDHSKIYENKTEDNNKINTRNNFSEEECSTEEDKKPDTDNVPELSQWEQDIEKADTSEENNPFGSSESPLPEEIQDVTTQDYISLYNEAHVNSTEMFTSINSNSSHGSSLIKTPEIKSLSSLIDPCVVDPSEGCSKVITQDAMQINILKGLKLTADDNDICDLTEEVVTPEDPLLQGLGFEIVPNSLTGSFTVHELQKMNKQLGVLSREQGLDHQNYQCKGCQDLLGSTISRAKVCAYTGEYFCANCMDSNVFIIPARVVHNWDFKRYPVSKKSAMYLLEFQHQPLLNMEKLNPKIYNGVSDMAYLRELRVQLNFLKSYIFNCKELPVIEELQKRIWPREYLYDHEHLYTISDLAQIPNGSLVLQLEKVVSFAKVHVYDCWFCSQKGFICEFCKSTEILYPFDTSTTYRCNECSSVYHLKCYNPNVPCPKCKRRQDRSN